MRAEVGVPDVKNVRFYPLITPRVVAVWVGSWMRVMSSGPPLLYFVAGLVPSLS